MYKHFQNYQKVPECCVPEKTDYPRDLTDSDEIQYPSRSKADKNFDSPTFLNFAIWSLGKTHEKKILR